MTTRPQQAYPMSKNPYQSPRDDQPAQVSEEIRRASWFDLAYLPLIWGVALFLLFVFWGLSAGGDIPPAVKIVSSVFTIAALATMILCIRGWRLLITAPLWAHLIWVQYLVWTFYAGK